MEETKRKLASIQIIKALNSIEGADRIELATVQGWNVVVKKDEFKIGDMVTYFQIDSLLPIKPDYEFLLKGSKPKKMLVDGKEIEGIRLRSVKLRGQLSQGLIMPLDIIPLTYLNKLVNEKSSLKEGDDLTETLNIYKWELPIPPELSGKMKGYFPSYIPRTDEERIQNMPEVLSSFYVSEKLDGTSTTYYKKDGNFGVCSRNIELLEGDTTQWKMAKQYDLVNKLPDNFAIQCELIGESIQGNSLKQKGQEIYCFNAYNISVGIYLNYTDFIGFCESLGVKTVPIIDDNYSLPSTIEGILAFADGKSKLNENEDREGIVVRPKVEMKYKGERLSFKAISNRYLLKHE